MSKSRQLTAYDLHTQLGIKPQDTPIFIHHVGGISGLFRVTGIRESPCGLIITTMANPEEEQEKDRLQVILDKVERIHQLIEPHFIGEKP